MVYPEKFCITNVSLENDMNDKNFFPTREKRKKKNKNVIKIKIIFIKFVL